MNVAILNKALRLERDLNVAASQGEIVSILYAALDDFGYEAFANGYDQAVIDHEEFLFDAFAAGVIAGADAEIREPRFNAHVAGAAITREQAPELYDALQAQNDYTLLPSPERFNEAGEQIDPATGEPFSTAKDFS